MRRGLWGFTATAVAIVTAAGCGHSPATPQVATKEFGGQERVSAPGFSVQRPANYRAATEADREDQRVARVLDAGGLAFLANDAANESTAFVLPGGSPFPSVPTEAFCNEMAGAFVRRGNADAASLRLSLYSGLGSGGCSLAFESVGRDGQRRRHGGLFFSARGQTYQLQTTIHVDAALASDVDGEWEDEALQTLITSWKFERLPPTTTSHFVAPVPKGFHEAADDAAKDARKRGGVVWVAAEAPVAGIIVASISVSPAIGATSPVTAESCRTELSPLDKTIRGIDVEVTEVAGRQVCRARGSDPAAPERQLSTALVEVAGQPIWVMCRYHVVDDDAAEACEAVPASLTAP